MFDNGSLGVLTMNKDLLNLGCFTRWPLYSCKWVYMFITPCWPICIISYMCYLYNIYILLYLFSGFKVLREQK